MREREERVRVDDGSGLFQRLASGCASRCSFLAVVAFVARIDTSAGKDPRTTVEREVRAALDEEHLEPLIGLA